MTDDKKKFFRRDHTDNGTNRWDTNDDDIMVNVNW